jgi:large-conductance mechanosensitive channel
VVLSALVAVANYEVATMLYSSAAPAIFIALTVLTETVPFIISAVLSFIVVFITAKSSDPTERVPETQTKLNVDAEETSH